MDQRNNKVEHGLRLPSNRAFVVQLSDDSNPDEGVVQGRAEHVVSGKTCRFRSLEQLQQFLSVSVRQE